MDIAPVSSAAYASIPGLLGSPVVKSASPAEQTKAVAGQFEAIMLRQLLSESVGSMMGSGKDAAGGVYGYLLTDVFANSIAAGGGLGLTKVIEQQLTPKGQVLAPAETPKPLSA